MNDLSDTFPLTNDLLKPWSMPALVLTALLLMGAAAWSYLRAPGGKRYRVGVVLGIRLVALVLVFLALSGTSCVNRDELKVPSILPVGVDVSQSMSAVKDEVGRVSRWEHLLQTLKDCKDVIKRLRDEHNIKVVFFKFGDEVAEFDPDDPGEADGKRTDTASLLRFLYDKYRGERYLRGLVILSDGADNVASDPPARSLAARFRNLPCPVYTFAFGSKSTAAKENDIILTSAVAEPSLVPAKGKVTLRALIDSLGRIGDTVRVAVLLDNKEVAAETTTLQLRKKNEVQISFDAPPERGEYKLTVKVQDKEGRLDALPGELSAENNKMESFLTVTREGVSVLLVERQERFPEPQILLEALAADKRIRVDVAWLRGPEQLDPDQKGLFQFDQQPYDVIILGDVTAARLREADPKALEKIKDRVFNKGAGLMMLGGPRAFGNGDWIGTPIEDILPVRLRDKDRQPVTGESKDDVALKPTPEGLKYLLRIADTPQASEEAWAKVQADRAESPGSPLNGATTLGEAVAGAQVFAEFLGKQQPQRLLVGRKVNTGRTLAFGGSTTYLWIRPKTGGKDAHSRFWRQAVLWLAQQEDTDDNLRIRPETRRLRVGDNLDFGVQLYGKQGEEVKDATYQVKIIDEKGGETIVPVLPGPQNPLEHRPLGKETFKPRRPGIYRIKASGKGHHPSGKEQKEVTGETEVRFIAYQDDAETTEKAANPDFLGELALAGGTQGYRRPGELIRLLESLPSKPLPNPPPRPSKFPDWRTTKGRSPFLVAFFLLFVQVLALEWFLRRRWGMV